MLLNIICLSIIALLTLVNADVSISSPKAGLEFDASSGTTTIDIAWIDSGSTPALSEFSEYVFKLCTGSNNDIDCFLELAELEKLDVTNRKYSLNLGNLAAGNGSFYIQITALIDDGYTIHYSSRFTLTGMTGTVKGTGSGAAPDAQYRLDEGTTATSIDSKSFTVPYTLQTGSMRFAPMQTQPGTTVTATAWSRRFPTSSVSYYTTFKKSPVVMTTTTLPWSYTVTSMINMATPADNPSVLGWYAASERIQSASLSSYATADTSGNSQKKRKRWDID